MATFRGPGAAFVVLVLLLTYGIHEGDGALPGDNVSVEWNNLLLQLLCTVPRIFGANILQVHLNLAQWHAMLALRQTGSCTTEEAVVAYASRKIVSNYFPFTQDELIDPLLLKQIKALKLSTSQKRLAKRLGEAVAGRLIRNRQPVFEFVLADLKEALDDAQEDPAPGIFRYLPNTTYSDTSPLAFNGLTVEQSFILPDAEAFRENYLSFLNPPEVPSHEWDREYESIVNVGRIGWPGRTAEMNYTFGVFSCPRVNSTFACNSQEVFWIQAATNALPKTTSLYDVVTTFAKITVALHDNEAMFIHLKYTFWFWRPAMAFRAGDARHPPIPDWTPYSYAGFDPEYPSGSASAYAAGATVLKGFFRKKEVGFTIDGNGAFGPECPGTAGDAIGPRRFDTIWAAVEESKRARMYAGAHYNISVEHGAMVGAAVGNYVMKHWGKTTPSGVLPDTEYLYVVVEAPKKAGESSPIRYEVW